MRSMANAPSPSVPSSERLLTIGEPVRCVTANCPEQWRDDWADWSGFVAGINFDPKVGRVNYTVTDHWPPRTNGDLSDGFYDGMLTSSAIEALPCVEILREALIEARAALADEVVGTVYQDDPAWYQKVDAAVAKIDAALTDTQGYVE